MNGTLESFQNPDGGWPYTQAGPSWTEPSAYALLSLLAEGRANSQEVSRGLSWLSKTQQPDGGWAPQPELNRSTWVSALIALLPPGALAESRQKANVNWLLSQTGSESGFVYRLKQWMVGNNSLANKTGEGWPWFPGASAWVTPTSLTLLALTKQKHVSESPVVADRITAGRAFLLTHACESGGWNHGASESLGYRATAYPETTGVALLALGGVSSAVKTAGLSAAGRFLNQCRSAEAKAWLTMGLLANGQTIPESSQNQVPRTVLDLALTRLSNTNFASSLSNT